MPASFESVIGLEVHCQLQTASKLFSAAPAAFTDDPNTNIDLVTLGHPGVLPVPNRKAIQYMIRLGLATHCKIRPVSYFARKHYFYPDLTKGYQISQYDDPICYDGCIEVEDDSIEGARYRIRINRIHLEEDAGKSIHDRDETRTYLDYNRAGVPLAEIVTEPDIRTPRQAFLYMKKIRQIVRYLGICDGNMEEGSLRCDANVSVRREGEETLGTKTEIKNMNSFRHVEAALEYEIARQIKVLSSGESVVQETRLWDTDRQVTLAMRSKEEAHDYRYFKDPDLPPLVVSADDIDSVRSRLPRLSDERIEHYQHDFQLPAYDAGVLTEEREIADYFEAVVTALDESPNPNPELVKQAANFVMTDVLRTIKTADTGAGDFPVTPEQLAGLVKLRVDGSISSTAAQEIFSELIVTDKTAEEIATTNNLLSVSDESALKPVVQKVIADNPKQVATYLGGKTTIVGYFIGQVMRAFDGSPDPNEVRRLIQEELENERR